MVSRGRKRTHTLRHEVPGVVIWSLFLYWGFGLEMLGDISYDEATLKIRGQIKYSLHTSLLRVFFGLTLPKLTLISLNHNDRWRMKNYAFFWAIHYRPSGVTTEDEQFIWQFIHLMLKQGEKQHLVLKITSRRTNMKITFERKWPDTSNSGYQLGYLVCEKTAAVRFGAYIEHSQKIPIQLGFTFI